MCLTSFVQVVERGTIAAAAQAQGYTAPAVSQHISKLEADLAATLFDRRGGRLVPTAAALALAPLALDLLDLETRCRAAVGQPPRVRHAVIAGLASALATVLAPRLDAIDRVATVEIVEAEDHEALRELGLGAVDIALVQEYDHAPIERNRRFTYTALATDPLVLVLPRRLRAETSIGELADADWLLNGRTTRCADATRLVLARHGITPRVVGHVDDNAALLALVAAGRGVTVVPSAVVRSRDRTLRIADQDLGVARTIHAVTRAATTDLAPVVDLMRARG